MKILLPLALSLLLSTPALAGPLGDSVTALEAQEAAAAAQIVLLQSQLAAAQTTIASQGATIAAQAATIKDLQDKLAAATAPPPPPSDSPSGTKCTTGSACTIVLSPDAWSITAAGQVARNGTPDANTSSVKLIESWQGKLYQTNGTGWWQYTPGAGWNGWTAVPGDPMASVAPPAPGTQAKAIIAEMLAHPGLDVQNNWVWSGSHNQAEIDYLAAQNPGFIRLDGLYDAGDYTFTKLNANWKAAFARWQAKGKIVIVGTGTAWADNGTTKYDDAVIASLPKLVADLKAMGADPLRTIIKVMNEFQREPDTINPFNARAYAALRAAGWSGPIMLCGGPWAQGNRAVYYSWPKGLSFLTPPATGAQDPLLFLEWHEYAPLPFTTQGTTDYPAAALGSVPLNLATYKAEIEAVFLDADAVKKKFGLYTINTESGVPSGAANDNERGLVMAYRADMAKKYGAPTSFFAVTYPSVCGTAASWYRATCKAANDTVPRLLPSVVGALAR